MELLRGPVRELPVRVVGHPPLQGRVRGDALRRRRAGGDDDLGPRGRGPLARHAPQRPRPRAPLRDAEEADRQLLRPEALGRERGGPQADGGGEEGSEAPALALT